MSNLLFPTFKGLDVKVGRVTVYSTLVQTSASGKELRASIQSAPRYRYTLQLNFIRQSGFSARTFTDELATLDAFYRAHRGRGESFLYQDPVEAVAAYFGTGDGITRTFQLLDPDGVPIAGAPESGTWTIYADGIPTSFHLVNANGTVDFDEDDAPGEGQILSWSGPFLRRVRFDSDELEVERLAALAWDGKTINLISVK